VGVGIFDDFAVAGRFSEEVASHTPDPGRRQRYAGEYALFMDAYRRLEPWFDQL
jgi:xylulokinase